MDIQWWRFCLLLSIAGSILSILIIVFQFVKVILYCLLCRGSRSFEICRHSMNLNLINMFFWLILRLYGNSTFSDYLGTLSIYWTRGGFSHNFWWWIDSSWLTALDQFFKLREICLLKDTRFHFWLLHFKSILVMETSAVWRVFIRIHFFLKIFP